MIPPEPTLEEEAQAKRGCYEMVLASWRTTKREWLWAEIESGRVNIGKIAANSLRKGLQNE